MGGRSGVGIRYYRPFLMLNHHEQNSVLGGNLTLENRFLLDNFDPSKFTYFHGNSKDQRAERLRSLCNQGET